MWRKAEISPLLPVLLAVFILFSPAELLLALLSAAAFHELGHALALRCCGGHVKCLRLTVLGAEMVLADASRLSYGAELLVTLAGPAVNLGLCAALSVLGARWEALYLFAAAQLVLGLYNLLPIRPLDGGRALWLLCAWCLDPFAADRLAGLVDGTFSGALLALGLWTWLRRGTPFLLLAALGLTLPRLGIAKSGEKG